MNWRKVFVVGGTTVAIGVYPVTKLVGAAYRVVDGYNAVANQTRAAPQLPFPVPEDGSVSLDDCAKAEGLTGFWERNAYKAVVGSEVMESLGDGWNFDSVENVLWRVENQWDPDAMREYNAPVYIDMKGGMPNGRTVPLRDYNGDGRVGPGKGSNDFRTQSKRDIKRTQRSETMAVMAIHG